MAAVEPGKLTPELAAIQVEIEGYARGYGLDFFPTIFELIDADQLNEIAARGGFPTRYPHWRFGMEYEQLSKGYHYGLQKIYEMVINNNPCYAYLMRSNGLIDQKMVMAHVYGHCDFFKNNQWFAHTNRKMMDDVANHGTRIRRIMDVVGVEDVENYIDACLSLEDLIDVHSPFIKRRKVADRFDFSAERQPPGSRSQRFDAKSYMQPFINPVDKLRAQQDRLKEEGESRPFPENPERDVLLFLLEHAPLKTWQADILAIIRDEAYYFAPQAQTKIMNEGWASYWHSTIMINQGLTAADVVNYCDHHSGTMASAPTQLNPYKVGIELFRNIEDRWNRGAFGREYDDCDDHDRRKNWNTHAGLGREKIFEVRRIHNDLTFIDEFLTLDFVREHKLFRFGYNPTSEAYEIESREFPRVKQQLLESLTNRGRPIIAVVDGNYKNRGELFLQHQYSGVELQLEQARDTLENLHRLWNRPVHIATVLEDEEAVISFDGSEHQLQSADPADDSEGRGMKLRDEFLRELQAIVGQTNRRVTVADGPRILRCEVDQCTALAAAVYEFILESKELAQVDTAILQQSSQSLCNRVNYLLEPISPIETDIDGCVVQMRSNPPQQNESGKYYYELFLRRGGSIALYRYEKQPGAIRSRVPVTLTHEVLGRLCEDFNATIEEILAS